MAANRKMMAPSPGSHIALEMDCFGGLQPMLSSALEKRDLDGFELALHSEADADLIDDKTNLSVFQKSCQTPGSAAFIKKCIDYGSDIEKPNQNLSGKLPIHFACDSQDPENLQVLLLHNVNVNSLYGDQSAVNYLMKTLSATNHEALFKCLNLLVEHGANLNLPDNRSMTPILIIAKTKIPEREKFIRYLIENTDVDLDNFRRGEARKVVAKDFPNIQMPLKRETDTVDFVTLKTLLIEGNEQVFVSKLKAYALSIDNVDNKTNIFNEDTGDGTLLQVAIRNGMDQAVDALLENGASPNYSLKKTTPIAMACLYGHFHILQKLLLLPGIVVTNVEPLLCIVVRKMSTQARGKKCNFQRCFEILCADDRIDVNECDVTGSTALHFAVKYQNTFAEKALLAKATYLGKSNQFKDLPITDINPKILEEYLDSCITTNGRRPGDDDFEIRFDYSSFAPKQVRKVDNISTSVGTVSGAEEMAPIAYIAKTSELKYLVKHPLISSFLFLKWHKLGMAFYTNLMLYSVYCFSLVLYLVLCYGHDASPQLDWLLWTLSICGAFYVLLREAVQCLISPKHYFTSLENYVEIALIVMTWTALCSGDKYPDNTQRVIAAVTILLAAIEFILLVGSLPILSISTHMVMLQTVSMSFLRSLALYSILLVAFALCFYTLLGGGNLPDQANGEKEEDDETKFNKFIDPGTAIIKTIVMLTGEFEAASINFGTNTTSYFIFVLFVFFIAIVLFNLLNGLAVSDTQAIKADAELTGFLSRVKLLMRYEKTMLGKQNSSWTTIFFQNTAIKKISSNVVNVFPNTLPMNMLILMPNKQGRVVIPEPGYELRKTSSSSPLLDRIDLNEKRDLETPLKPLLCCFFSEQCSRMDGKVVKYARCLLEKRAQNAIVDSEKEELNKRLTQIEEQLIAIREAIVPRK